jgi:hypothetical protein
MLTFTLETGQIDDPQRAVSFADRPYHFTITGQRPGGARMTEDVQVQDIDTLTPGETTLAGSFEKLGLQVQQVVWLSKAGLEEILTIQNTTGASILIDQIEAGFCADLKARPGWRLCAIPFRVQLDGSLHDYPAQALIDGQFHNAVFEDNTRQYMPPLTEEGSLRSEAWAWGDERGGLVIIKYNNQEIELSVARPLHEARETWLQFGGAGFCLYGEPSGARRLEPGQSFTFGATSYIPYSGNITVAYQIYRDFLDAHGHTFPSDYNPPVNWNELYDIGWYHSRSEDLKQFSTRAALLEEAAKAKEVGCELLYLDPGWEVCEGTTLWDESRLGSVKSLVDELKSKYGLDLAYRTVLRTYKDMWPAEYLVQHTNGSNQPIPFGEQSFWETCLCNPDFWNEKLRRILEISKQGVRFMMIDEFDWRGACIHPDHHHANPTTALDHSMAVYRLSNAIRQACPGLTIETHDPIWPWSTCIYVPTYFQHGFGNTGSYDENWGFEYMWDCLNDLKSGRALALYYYNLGCNVPLYLHITMAADNDACVFFWWTASTVRHLGIGGKESNKTIEPADGLPPRDSEARFAAYKQQMALYKRLKPYFVRGEFHGIAETAHLHTLPGKPGGVLNVFNLTDVEKDVEYFIPAHLIHADAELPVSGAVVEWKPGGVTVRLTLPPMTPAVVCIGDALK